MRTSAIVGIALLAGCGKIGPLQPAPGHSLPVKPALARATPTPDQLLTPPPYGKPDRVDELVKKSEARQSDPFDLPPPSGGAAPALPAGTDPQPVDNTTGPATPK